MDDFFKYLKEKHNIRLTEQQKEAVMHIVGPHLIIAVPGAGKTTALVCKIANLILNCGINPENILTVTFSRSSAKDMKDRFYSIFGGEVKDQVHFSTIHSLSYKIIREYAKEKKRKFIIIEGEDAPIQKNAILKKIYREVNEEFINEDKLEELNGILGYMSNMMLNEKYFDKEICEIDNIKEIYLQYKSILEKNDYMDYDRMLTLCYEILVNNKSLLNKYRNKYEHIMVDEAQDTSVVQHKIIELLADKLGKNLCMVADDDQSIYSWRGGCVSKVLEFDKTYPGAKIYFMEQNFRSTKSITEPANIFIKKNLKRYKKNIYNESEIGEKINILSLRDEEEQTNYIINELKKGNRYSDYAILFRNNLSSISIADTMDRNGINFYIRDGKLHFFRHWVTQNIAAFLKLALNNREIESFSQIYYRMNGYISRQAYEYAAKMMQYDNSSIFDILIKSDIEYGYKKIKIVEIKDNFRVLRNCAPKDAIEYIEQVMGYYDYLSNNSKAMGYSMDNLNFIMTNLKQIAKYTKTIPEFLERLDQLQVVMENAKYNKNKNAVTLTTLHSSKGLEWPICIIIDLIEGTFPSKESVERYKIGDDALLEEERRLMYVGITRAKKSLTLITLKYKNESKVSESMFLDEVRFALMPEKERVKKEKTTYIKDGKNYLTYKNLDGLKFGTKINHKVFLQGEIKEINNDVLIAEFDVWGQIKLSLRHCIEKRLIRII